MSLQFQTKKAHTRATDYAVCIEEGAGIDPAPTHRCRPFRPSRPGEASAVAPSIGVVGPRSRIASARAHLSCRRSSRRPDYPPETLSLGRRFPPLIPTSALTSTSINIFWPHPDDSPTVAFLTQPTFQTTSSCAPTKRREHSAPSPGSHSRYAPRPSLLKLTSFLVLSL